LIETGNKDDSSETRKKPLSGPKYSLGAGEGIGYKFVQTLITTYNNPKSFYILPFNSFH